MPSAKAGDTSETIEGLVPFEVFPYASYLPGRTNGSGGWYTPRNFKRHGTLGHAKGAVSGRSDAKIYKWEGVIGEGGTWVELTDWKS